MVLYVDMSAAEIVRHKQIKKWKHEAHTLLDLMFDRLGNFHKYNYIAKRCNRDIKRNAHFTNMNDVETLEVLAHLKERAWRKGFIKLSAEIF